MHITCQKAQEKLHVSLFYVLRFKNPLIDWSSESDSRIFLVGGLSPVLIEILGTDCLAFLV
jgi:hypothetical protein